MKELIKITEQDGRHAVSARELHAFLGSKRDFSNWIKDRITKYDLIEECDFTLAKIVERGKSGAQTKIEYALTIDCAKELAMVEGNEKGKQARRYFIECEKELKEISKPQSQIDIIIQSAIQLKETQDRLTAVEKDIEGIKAVTTRPNYFTVVGYATLHNITVSMKQAAHIGRKASTICKKRKIEIDTIPDPRFGVVNTYPMEVLDDVYNNCQY